MTTPQELRCIVADWNDNELEGYWELMDTAASANAANGDDGRSQHFAELAQTCEEALTQRWANK